MKTMLLKIILRLFFFIFELSIPFLFYASATIAWNKYVELRVNKFDVNGDGIWTEDEKINDFNYWYNIYIGDGGRNVGCLLVLFSSVVFGSIFRIIFIIGDKINYIVEKHYWPINK